MGIDLILERHSEVLPGQMSLFNEIKRDSFGTKPDSNPET
jgi:hypothetical protein